MQWSHKRGLIAFRRLLAWAAIIACLLIGGAWNAQREYVSGLQRRCWARGARHFHVHYNRDGTRDAVCWDARRNVVAWRRPL